MNVLDFYPLFLQSTAVTIDSRNVKKGDLFFAFSGERFNGAEYAAEAVEKGALAVIVEQKKYEDISRKIFAVPSTLAFLQELASYHRDQLDIPVIALTGSNGKTTTKEIMHAVLSKKYRTQYTSGNLNNHIGVPLTLLSIRSNHQMAVVEMGANHQKEISELCRIAKPDFGYITNFGKAHLEGFGGVEGVIRGKSEMYTWLHQHGGIVLVNTDDPLQMEKNESYVRKITFGKKGADYLFEVLLQDNFIGLRYGDLEAISNLTGAYNFSNLCAAAALGLHFGVPFTEVAEAITEYKPTNMRSQIQKTKGKTLLLDTYNANPSSMQESLKNFSSFAGTKTVVLGDMLELGEYALEEHQEIVSLAEAFSFDKIFTVGPNFSKCTGRFQSFHDTAQLAEFLKQNPIATDNVLLKGSRGIALEQLLEQLA